MYKTIDPKNSSVRKFHHYLLGVVAPRPIAFASTVDKEGNINLSPFSYFNTFGSNPPVLIFSVSNRVRNNTTKDTLDNVKEVPEVTISIVNYAIVEQMSLSSVEYDKSVNEFVKAGLTATASEKVKPPRVGEAPASFECIVKDVISTGEQGGAGNLVICEVVLAHFKEDILGEKDAIDPFKLDAVARMGGNWYCRANSEALFEIPKPNTKKGIGVDEIPEKIRESNILTGNNIGRLGNIETLPSQEFIEKVREENIELKNLLTRLDKSHEQFTEALHLLAQKYLAKGKLEEAWAILLQN